jgi:hypothetical protein
MVDVVRRLWAVAVDMLRCTHCAFEFDVKRDRRRETRAKTRYIKLILEFYFLFLFHFHFHSTSSPLHTG